MRYWTPLPAILALTWLCGQDPVPVAVVYPLVVPLGWWLAADKDVKDEKEEETR